MGFDIECIVNIQTYPGEYFCPVCRTLVYPNEALQSLCTHLYCKPCLAHVANTTKACPYDGYLVTEADSKPLIESDKALADNIGKVKVHCQFHGSGCTWEGILSESSSHCSGCTFGNSLVICNSCGVQLEHRLVHGHAQTCSGTYQAPKAVDVNQNAVSSTVTASMTHVDQSHSASQAQISQTSVALLPSGQAPNQQAIASSQTGAVGPSATLAPDQWYQQQYYQQYAGYNPYQQSYQQYNPYPQQLGQTYQQGQYNSQAYVQPQPPNQPQGQAHFQSYPVPQAPTQPQTSPQPQPQPQPQSQSQEKVTQLPVALQGTNQLQSHVQSAAPHHQQVNSQQQFSSSQQPLPQGNAFFHSQPQPQQYVQVPAYQQPIQSTHPAQPSQPQNLNQPQIQPQQNIHNQSLQYSQQYPPQFNQHPVPNAQPHASHPANTGVTGHQSYQPHQMQNAPTEQHAVHSHLVTGSVPVHGNMPHQPPSSLPPLSHGLVANQQKPAVPMHMPNNHHTQPQHVHSHANPPASLGQHRPSIRSIQQSIPLQSQGFHALQSQHSHFGQQQPSQLQGFHALQRQHSHVGVFEPAAQNKPAPLGLNYLSDSNTFAKGESDTPRLVQSRKDTNVSSDSVEHKAGNPGQHMKIEKEESRDGPGSSRIVGNDTDMEVKKGGANDLEMQQISKEERNGDLSDTSVEKSLGAPAKENVETAVCEELESLSNQKESYAANQDSQTANLCASNANGSDNFAEPSKSESMHSSGLLHPQTHGLSPTPSKSQKPDHVPRHAPIIEFHGPGSTASYGRGIGTLGPPPRSYDLQSGPSQPPSLRGLPPYSVDPRSRMMGRALVHGPEGPLGHEATGITSPAFALRNDRFNFPEGEHANPFSNEQVRSFDQDGRAGPPSRFMPPPPDPDIILDQDPQFGIHDSFRGTDAALHADDFLRPNPGFGRNGGMPPHEPHAFGGPIPFNLPPQYVGDSLHENRFPGLPSNMQRIERDGTEHLRYREHIALAHRHKHLRVLDPSREEFASDFSWSGDMSGPRNFPGPFHSGDAAGFGVLPIRGRIGEMAGGFSHRLPGRESFRGNFSDFPRLGEIGFRSNYSRQGFADDRFHADDLGPFEMSRKRKPMSMGWCRLCKIDCESAEGLDVHSQSKEHQRKAMVIVKTIKQQNKKQSKIPGDHAPTL